MEAIQSFKVDHTNLYPGLYVSREGKGFTTYDLRVTAPNHEPAMHPNAVHTIEHLGAMYFRNESSIKDDVVYFGPMGCLTGFYLILSGEHSIEQVLDLVLDCFSYIRKFQGRIPGAEPEMCGNYLLHDLPMARYYASRYLCALSNNTSHQYSYI